MIVIIKLILAHLLGDFLFQPKAWVEDKIEKKIRSRKLYFHILLHGVLVMIIFRDLRFWPLALLIMFTHGLIDILKIYLQNDNNKISSFLLDQGLHLLSIWMIGVWWLDLPMIPQWLYSPEGEILLTALILLTVASGIVIQILLSGWSKTFEEDDDNSLSNAGKYIGILERLFAWGFILTGHWEGIGFLIAAKSVFRFGDLKESKNRKLTEYVLVGTLLSFGIAIVIGLLTLWAMENI